MKYSDRSEPIVNAPMNYVPAGGTIPTQVAWMINETSVMKVICDQSNFKYGQRCYQGQFYRWRQIVTNGGYK